MAKQEGRHYRFEKYEFFAERGMITLIDVEAAGDSASGVDDKMWRIPPGKFLKRVIAARMAYPDLHADKAKELRDLLENAAAACKLAKAQGDPTDPSVIDDVVRHQRKRHIVLPHELPAMPGLGPKMKVKAHGSTAGEMLTNDATVIPDFTIN